MLLDSVPWTEWHSCLDILLETHLIGPSETSVDYALRHKLLPFRKWLNITHSDTFIHSPFEFTSIWGLKTRDCISQDDWNGLLQHVSMFQSPIPSFDVLAYLIHVDCRAHVTYHDQAHCVNLCIEASHMSEGSSNQCYPWQKVLGLTKAYPHFFFFFKRDIFASFRIRRRSVTSYFFGHIAPGMCDAYLLVIRHWYFDTLVLSAECLVSLLSSICGPRKGLSP